MTTVESHLLKHPREFVAFARKRLKAPELAADAVQKSLLKALRAEAQIQDGEKTKAWFYRILRRTIVDSYRRRDARDRALADLQHELNAPADSDEEAVVCACLGRLLPAMAPQYATLIRRLDLNEEAPDRVARELGTARRI